jgi:hypothetical protein
VRIVRKPLKCLLLTAALLVLTSSLWFKIVPQKYLSPFIGKSSVVDKLVCNFSTKVSGQSMNPVIKPGTAVGLTRCFEEKDLTQNTVALYLDNSSMRFGVIRHILDLNPVVYKISDEKSPELLHDIIKEEIIGITHDIDVSKTKYQAQKKTESFILKPNDFLADFYLGKIPRGYGEEMAEVEKASTFSKDKDKFCMIVIPKKELTFVDIEIIDAQTEETIISNKKIVFNVRPEPNTNCQDFGEDQGMLSLKPGNYRYRFLMNHQVLEEVRFTVN